MKDRRFYSCETRGFNEQGNLIGAAVTGKPNRVDEVMSASAIDVKSYMRNPVILYAHNWSDLPIGKTVKIWEEGDDLMFEGEFAEHEKAQTVKDLYATGFLNAFSIGFTILETKFDAELNVNRHTKVELLEISSVPVPADANALQSTSFYSFGDMLGAIVHNNGDTREVAEGGLIVDPDLIHGTLSVDPPGDSVWQQSVRRMEHLIKEVRNGRRENATDMAMLREISTIAAALAATSKQSGGYLDAIEALVQYLGEDQFDQAFLDLDRLVGSLMPERIPQRILDAMSQAKLAMKQEIERGKRT